MISHEDKRNHSHHQPHHSHHLHQDLLTLKISDIFQKKQDLIEVSTQETIQQVLSLFHLHRIHSLPVYEDHHDPFQRIYKGIVSIVDVLIFINRYQAIGNESPQDLFQQPIRKAIGATKESSNLFIQNDQSSLSVVIDKMCQGFPYLSLVCDSCRRVPSLYCFKLSGPE